MSETQNTATTNDPELSDVELSLIHGPRLPEGLYNSLSGKANILAIAGMTLTLISILMPWAYVRSVLGDVTFWVNPAPVQYAFGIVPLLLAGIFIWRKTTASGAFLDLGGACRAAGWAITVGAVLVVLAIVASTGAILNCEVGIFVTLIGGLLLLLAGYAYPRSETPIGEDVPELPGWVSALVLTVLVALGLFSTAYILGENDAWTFILVFGAAVALAFLTIRSQLSQFLSSVAAQQRSVMLLATFAAAFALPLTQDGSDALMSVATQVLIFAATAVGLNIVVGLAGLLDLGYIAFLGAGAYVGAILSGSAFSSIGWTPPFFVTVLIGMCVSAILGLIIGSPTLRVSGDYLAIVTLAFGEIFRLAMLNLDGSKGTIKLTGGPDGIPAIPGLQIFGLDFSKSWELGGITITKFGNYYMLLLVMMAIIIMVFSRLNTSRIGRGWVAIREDEKAAEAMGVNVFGLKLLAFAGGAALAGMAGTVKAHVDVSVTPDQYIFLESAFLLAAVVLGGMGTVTGVIVGAVMLKLLPEKLRFFSEYRLLMFGILLVVMMRFRPGGLVQVKRRHPADDYPEAVEEGRNRPIDGAILGGSSK